MGFLAGAAYIALVWIIGSGALRNRDPQARSGILLAMLLATLPVWIMGMYWLCNSLGLFRDHFPPPG